MSTKQNQDSPYHRRTIMEMTEYELEQYIVSIRERRMQVRHEIQLAIKVKEQIQHEKNKERIARLAVMIEKDLTALDKTLNRVETRVTELINLRLVAERM